MASGFILANLLAGAYLAIAHRNSHTGAYGEDLCSLIGLWVGFVGSAVFASKFGQRGESSRSLAVDYGLRVRPLIDVPLGIAIGVASQFALVPLLELPLAPFVHNLSQQIGKPAEQLTGNVFGAGFVVLAIFVCAGSPFVEEVFFRGLLLRGLLGWIGPRLAARRTSDGSGVGDPPERAVSQPGPLGVTIAVVVSSLLFALVHFEAIQFLGLAGFGAVLALLAWRTGRLGPGIVAHAAFNTVAILAIATSR